MLRNLVWDKIDTSKMMRYYGTAAPPPPSPTPSQEAAKTGWLPGFEEKIMGQPDATSVRWKIQTPAK
jgi:hypothetical protein